MTQAPSPVTDADLHAFVDGRLDESRRSVVLQYLAEHEDQQQRVQDWMDQADGLRRALRRDDPVERAAILARLAGALPRRAAGPAAFRRLATAASIVLALGVGGIGGWVAHNNRNLTEIARLGIEATTAYTVFANDANRPIEISSDDRVELVNWITQKLGRRVTIPDLSPMGYQLMGGRVLTALYGPAAMLLYKDANDDRITVYLQPMRIGLPEPMRPIQGQAVDGYAWIDHQVGYTVMSDGNTARLHNVANHVREDARF
jgi:anti-sigma factor RsiW